MVKSKNTLLILFLSIFIDLIGFGIVIPLLPLYAKSFGASASTITLLFSAYCLASFIASPFWGIWSDRMGRRPLLLLSLAGSGVAYIGFALANSLFWLFVTRILAGVMGCTMVVAQAYVGDITTPENRSKGMGILGVAYGLGFTLGPALSSFLVGIGGSETNFRLPLLGAGGLSFLAFIFAWLQLPESRPSHPGDMTAEKFHTPKTQRLGNPWALLKKSPLLFFFIGLTFLLTFGVSGVQSILVLWLSEVWQLGAVHVGYVFLLMGLMTAFTQGRLVGVLVKRRGEMNVLLAGFGIAGLAILSFPLSSSLPLLIGSLIGMSLGLSFCQPTLKSLLSQAAGAEIQGAAAGMSQAARSIASITAPVVSGLLFEYINPGAPMILAGSLILGQMVLSWIGLSRSPLSQDS